MVYCTCRFDQTNKLVLRLDRIMAKLNHWKADNKIKFSKHTNKKHHSVTYMYMY